MAMYMSGLSVKLQWLAGKFHDICNVTKTKVILFYDWPMTLWNTIVFVMNLGFDVVDIRSAHTLADRDAAARSLNNSNSAAQILVTSTRTMSAFSAKEFNLQWYVIHILNWFSTTRFSAVWHPEGPQSKI